MPILWRTLAAICAVLAFVGSLTACTIVTTWLLTTWYGWGHPGDGSAGDSAGWALIIAAPVEIPVFLTIAGGAAVIAYSRAMRWVRAIPQDDHEAGSEEI